MAMRREGGEKLYELKVIQSGTNLLEINAFWKVNDKFINKHIRIMGVEETLIEW